MAYEKHTWECGETVTADKLNHMEDGIAEGGGGGCDCGFECIDNYNELFDGRVTTTEDYHMVNVAEGKFSPSIPNEVKRIRVTFNGTIYYADRNENGFGAPFTSTPGERDWSEYPFYLQSGIIQTENAWAHTLKIETFRNTTITMTECFEKAVEKVTAPVEFNGTYSGESELVLNVYTGAKYDDAVNAATSGKRVTLVVDDLEGFGGFYNMAAYNEERGIFSFCGYGSDSNGYYVDIFTVTSNNALSHQRKYIE